jgi:hypothetical protein
MPSRTALLSASGGVGALAEGDAGGVSGAGEDGADVVAVAPARPPQAAIATHPAAPHSRARRVGSVIESSRAGPTDFLSTPRREVRKGFRPRRAT